MHTSTLTNVVLLINMLNHRRSVSIATIMRECRASRSTAYRYIRAISEANFPVIYDQESHGFRFTHPGKRIPQYAF